MRLKYLSLNSTFSGSTPWFQVDDMRNGIALGLQVVTTPAASAAWQVDVTMDDPFGATPNPTLNGGLGIPFYQSVPGSSQSLVTVFQSSQVGGWGSSGSTSVNFGYGFCFAGNQAGSTAAAQNAVIGGINQPVFAVRLTMLSSISAPTGSSTVMTILQPGPR